MSLFNISQELSKSKMDDYAPDGDGSSSSSVRVRTDDGANSEMSFIVCDGPSGAACWGESWKTKTSCIQFFVRILSGLHIFIQADLSVKVETVHEKIQSKTGIPVKEHRLIYKSKQLYGEQTLAECGIEKDGVVQLVGIMRSTNYPNAYQLLDEIVYLISQLCQGRSENVANDQKLRAKIKSNFSDYFDKLPKNNNEKASEYLKVFWSSGAPAALAMLYMSPGNHIFCSELMRELVKVITLMPRSLYLQCAPIFLEICKSLRMVPFYNNDSVFNMCRGCLVHMVEYIKIGTVSSADGSTDYFVTLRDMLAFVAEAIIKISSNVHVGIEEDTSTDLSLTLMNDVLYFKNFMIPVSNYFKDELCARRNSNPLILSLSYSSIVRVDLMNLFDICYKLFKKIDNCLENIEVLLPTNSESLGCYQYLVILKELHDIFKFVPCIGSSFWTTLRARKVSFCYLLIKYARESDDYGWIFEHKEVTNFECRRHLAMLLLPEIRDAYFDDVLEMLIERSQLLAESFEYIAHAEPDTLRAGLLLEFKDEEATGPGVLREWFILVCQAIFDPQNGLFVACPNDRRRFFLNPASKVDQLHLEYFKFAGRVIALALMHQVQVGIVFDRVLFLQLAGRSVSLEDTRDADPLLYNSCIKILEMDPEVVDQDALALTFVVETDDFGSRNVVELCPDGKNTAVNSTNRRNYVNLLLQYRFVHSVAEQVAQFTRGFDEIIDSARLRNSFFRCLELEDLDWMLYGSDKAICVEDWKAHTEYHGYKETDPQIVWFWEAVGSMSAEQRKVLLFFWTSLKYLPVEGFGGLTSLLSIHKFDESCNRLPSSQTCYYQLCFPPYRSFKVMQDRLRVITQEHVGCSFGAF